TTGYENGTPAPGNFPDAFYYDLRRADNSHGYPFNRSSATPFVPRPVAKIDFDLTRFRLAVERTMTGATTSSAIFNPAVPDATNWSHNVLNAGATTAAVSLYPNGYTGFPTDTVGDVTCDPFRLYYPSGVAVSAANLINPSAPSPWFDGITVYIHSVDAEVKDGTRTDSGVRLWNGRGPVVSLSNTYYPGRTGFSFGTNDAAYVVGHFNADGSINATSSSGSNPGGYSARYPDTANEMLASVMADAITILSQPMFTKSGSNYYQTGGWTDTLSSNRRDSTNWSSTWYRSNPSTSNRTDGISNSLRPALMPNLSVHETAGDPYRGTGASSYSVKFAPSVTEISACMLTGIVPTTNNQTSGGVHNFPRLLEQWSGTGLY
ncbi:MAG: hypothetical protein K8E66_07745, partial [Phycisphaerales bacterium]|nr:hypothetical protein [Phycisphaerales bacterium]